MFKVKSRFSAAHGFLLDWEIVFFDKTDKRHLKSRFDVVQGSRIHANYKHPKSKELFYVSWCICLSILSLFHLFNFKLLYVPLFICVAAVSFNCHLHKHL